MKLKLDKLKLCPVVAIANDRFRSTVGESGLHLLDDLILTSVLYPQTL